MQDPYKVLGIDRNATDEEIKSAYRALAKKYHPDNFVNSPIADVAEEKMKEVNEAYQQIQDERQEKSGGGNSYGRTQYSTNTGDRSAHASQYIHVRELINAGKTNEANEILDSIPVYDRNAEWNFLKGCIQTQKGWYYEAQQSFDAACAMDPNNTEYQDAQFRMKNASQNFGRSYRTTTTTGGASACDICQGLICADCLCECCGGDLVPCC